MPDHFWLGTNPVQQQSNRVAVPKPVFHLQLLYEEDDAFWGTDPEADRITVSGRKQAFRDQGIPSSRQFKQVGTTSVQSNRVVTIPKQFFPDDFEGQAKYETPLPEKYALTYGESLHFITSTDIAFLGVCYVFNDVLGRTFLEDRLAPIPHVHEVALTGAAWEETEEESDEQTDKPMEPDGGESEPEMKEDVPITAEGDVIPEAVVADDEVLHIETGEVIPVYEAQRLIAESLSEEPRPSVRKMLDDIEELYGDDAPEHIRDLESELRFRRD